MRFYRKRERKEYYNSINFLTDFSLFLRGICFDIISTCSFFVAGKFYMFSFSLHFFFYRPKFRTQNVAPNWREISNSKKVNEVFRELFAQEFDGIFYHRFNQVQSSYYYFGVQF